MAGRKDYLILTGMLLGGAIRRLRLLDAYLPS